MRSVLFWLLCLAPALATAVDFDEFTRQLPLGAELQVFEDVRGDTTIAEVTSPALADNFRQHAHAVLNAGYSRSVFWLRLDLHYSDWIGRLVRLPVRSQLPAHWRTQSLG